MFSPVLGVLDEIASFRFVRLIILVGLEYPLSVRMRQICHPSVLLILKHTKIETHNHRGEDAMHNDLASLKPSVVRIGSSLLTKATQVLHCTGVPSSYMYHINNKYDIEKVI